MSAKVWMKLKQANAVANFQWAEYTAVSLIVFLLTMTATTEAQSLGQKLNVTSLGLVPSNIGDYFFDGERSYARKSSQGDVNATFKYFLRNNASSRVEIELQWQEPSSDRSSLDVEYGPQARFFNAGSRSPYFFASDTHQVNGYIRVEKDVQLDQKSLDQIADYVISRSNLRAEKLPVHVLAANFPKQFQGQTLGSVWTSEGNNGNWSEVKANYGTPQGGGASDAFHIKFTFYRDLSGNWQNDERLKEGISKIQSVNRVLAAEYSLRNNGKVSLDLVRQLATEVIGRLEPLAAKRPGVLLTTDDVSENAGRTHIESPFSVDPKDTGSPSPSFESFFDDADPESSLRALETRDAAAISTILVALILVGTAGGLNLAQAIASAIASAVQAGIEVSTDHVIDAVFDLPLQPNGPTNFPDVFAGNQVEVTDSSVSVDSQPVGGASPLADAIEPSPSEEPLQGSQPETVPVELVPAEIVPPEGIPPEGIQPEGIQPEDDQPSDAANEAPPFAPKAPSVPAALVDGDETVPFRGTRELFDRANRAMFGEMPLRGKSSSSLVDEPPVPGSDPNRPLPDAPSVGSENQPNTSEPATTETAAPTDSTATAADTAETDPRGSTSTKTVPESERQTTDSNTEPINPFTLRDPATGELLPRDVNGRVQYGGEWMSTEEAQRRTNMDADALQRATAATQRVDSFKDAVDQLNAETDPQRRAELLAEVQRQANEFHSDYDGRSTLKSEGLTPYSAALDNAIQETNRTKVDPAHLQELNSMGLKIGDKPLDDSSLIDFRNKSSEGTVPTDRDRGLNESKFREALEAMEKAKPGSQEAYEAAQRLAKARQEGKLTLDPDQFDQYLRDKRAAANEQLEQLEQQKNGLPLDSPERLELERQQRRIEEQVVPGIDQRQTELDGIKPRHQALQNARIEELQRSLARHPPDSTQAERIRQTIEGLKSETKIPITTSRFGDYAQETYNDVFEKVTGKSSRGALQALTHSKDKEAFGDVNVLKGIGPDNLPDPRQASQTASVANVKSTENQHLVDEGHFTPGQAIKETARGYAKDLGTKVMPLVESDPKITPERLSQLRRIHEVLDDVGKGKILPGQADLALKQALPEIPNMNMAKATGMVDANFEAAIKWRSQPTRMSAGDAFGQVSDLKGTLDEYDKLRQGGANVIDATGTSIAKTQAGNALYANQPGIGMAGALLPQGARAALPDQFAGELIDKGRDMLGAAARDLGQSTVTGEISGDHFRQTAEEIARGGGTVGGYGRLGAFLGDEFGRASQQNPDGSTMQTIGRATNNLLEDTYNIYQTGELRNQATAAQEGFDRYVTEDLRTSALRGEHGAPLQGVYQTLDLTNEILIDPVRFAEDTQALREEGWIMDRDGNFGNGLLFDRPLQQQVATNVDHALSGTPVINVPYTGLRDIGRTVADSEFRQEMREGLDGMTHELGQFMFGGTTNNGKGR